jgi:hypothetical protein
MCVVRSRSIWALSPTCKAAGFWYYPALSTGTPCACWIIPTIRSAEVTLRCSGKRLSRPRPAPQQLHSPNAQSCARKSDENEPKLSRQLRPFRNAAPDMCQSEQSKDCCGGDEIGFHRIISVRRPVIRLLLYNKPTTTTASAPTKLANGRKVVRRSRTALLHPV